MMVIMALRDTATVFGVTDATLSLASPVGESQCGNNERERSRGGGNDGEKEIGGSMCPRYKVARR